MLRPPELDHIVPIAHGGFHILRNIRFTHMPCNRARTQLKRPRVTVNRANGQNYIIDPADDVWANAAGVW